MGVFGRPHPHKGYHGPHHRHKQEGVSLSHPRKAESPTGEPHHTEHHGHHHHSHHHIGHHTHHTHHHHQKV